MGSATAGMAEYRGHGEAGVGRARRGGPARRQKRGAGCLHAADRKEDRVEEQRGRSGARGGREWSALSFSKLTADRQRDGSRQLRVASPESARDDLCYLGGVGHLCDLLTEARGGSSHFWVG